MPAEGAMVNEFCPGITFQFAGYEILTPFWFASFSSALGFTCSYETFAICAAVAGAAITACFTLSGTAPFWMFSCAQRPCLAPSAISCAVYAFVLLASARAVSKLVLLLT